MAELNSDNIVGVRYYVAIGPRYKFDYVDTEPCSAALSVSTIKGTVTGVPKMGSAMWLAFVGVPMDSRDFGCSTAPTDWGGPGGVEPGTDNFNYIYTEPGGYWATVQDGSGHALAARFVRVIYPFKPLDKSLISLSDISYPVEVDGVCQGTVDSGFALKLKLQLTSTDYTEDMIGEIPNHAMLGIFAIDQKEMSGPVRPKVHLVAGGFITERNLRVVPGNAELSFTAYGPAYWLLQADMREQQYIDPGIISATLGSEALVTVNGGNPLTTDVLGTGYVANHWLLCSPTIVAMHILQHVHVYAGNDSAPMMTSPTMATPTPGQGASYGTLGQFMDISVDDPNFDEFAGAAQSGFASFSITDGKVLSNIRQLLDNEGWRYYDKHNLTQCFERRPQYRQTFIPDPPPPTPTSPIGPAPSPYMFGGAYSSDIETRWMQAWADYYHQYKAWKIAGAFLVAGTGYLSPPTLPLPISVDYDIKMYTPATQFHYPSPDNLLDPGVLASVGLSSVAPWAYYHEVLNFFKFYSYQRTGHYEERQPLPVLELYGFDDLPGEVLLQNAGERPVRQVIIEKPPIVSLSDMTQADAPPAATSTIAAGLPPSVPPPAPRQPYENSFVITDPGFGATTSQKTQYHAAAFTQAATNGAAGNNNFTQDGGGANMTINPTQYYDYYPSPARAYGRTIGPLKNVYTLNGVRYAQGRDKEERLTWSVQLPVGQVFDVGLGDLEKIHYVRRAIQANWPNGKLFDNQVMQIELRPGRFFVTFQAQEVNPDE